MVPDPSIAMSADPSAGRGFDAAMAAQRVSQAERPLGPSRVETIGRDHVGPGGPGSLRELAASRTMDRWQGAIDGVLGAARAAGTDSRWTRVEDPAVRIAVEAAKDFRKQSVEFSLSMMKFGFILEVPKKLTGKLDAFLKG